MDSGTYFIFRQKSGFNFTNPQTIVVSGIETFTFTDGVVAGAATAARLTAVNEIMGLNGVPPVTALNTGDPGEVGEAERILDLINEKVQLRGWNTNRELQVDFTPGVGGVITFTADVLAAQYPTVRGGHRTIGDPIDAWCVRAGKLFNQVEQTNDFSELSVVTLDIIRLITFDTLPHALRDHIIIRAAIQFNLEKLNDQSVARQLFLLAQESLSAAQREDDLMGNPVNVLTSAHARAIRGFRRFKSLGGGTGV